MVVPKEGYTYGQMEANKDIYWKRAAELMNTSGGARFLFTLAEELYRNGDESVVIAASKKSFNAHIFSLALRWNLKPYPTSPDTYFSKGIRVDSLGIPLEVNVLV